jgi:hypothetical protein
MSSCYWCCCTRKGFQSLIEYSERGDYSVEDTIELDIPTPTLTPKVGWLDVKIGVAIIWTKYFCIIERGQFHLYSNAVDKIDPASSEFQGDIDLVGAILLGSRTGNYIEVRGEDLSSYIRFNSSSECDSW